MTPRRVRRRILYATRRTHQRDRVRPSRAIALVFLQIPDITYRIGGESASASRKISRVLTDRESDARKTHRAAIYIFPDFVFDARMNRLMRRRSGMRAASDRREAR